MTKMQKWACPLTGNKFSGKCPQTACLWQSQLTPKGCWHGAGPPTQRNWIKHRNPSTKLANKVRDAVRKAEVQFNICVFLDKYARYVTPLEMYTAKELALWNELAPKKPLRLIPSIDSVERFGAMLKKDSYERFSDSYLQTSKNKLMEKLLMENSPLALFRKFKKIGQQ